MLLPSVLWRCWLGGRKGIRPVKNWVVGCWCGCLERVADLHMAQLMPLPLTLSCFRKIQIGFTFLVLAHPGSPGKRAIKLACVCVTSMSLVPSVLWHCCLGVRKNIQPVKIEQWGVDVIISLVWGTDSLIWSSWCHCHPRTLSSLASDWFYLSGTGFPRLSRKRGC